MNIKCNKCGESINICNENVEFVKMFNPLLNENYFVVKLKYQTFCPNCLEYLNGIKRKTLTLSDIIKIMEDNKYGNTRIM